MSRSSAVTGPHCFVYLFIYFPSRNASQWNAEEDREAQSSADLEDDGIDRKLEQTFYSLTWGF